MQQSEQKPDFIKMEHEILGFWEENECFKKLVEKNKDNMPFRFLDGPITANNPMGVHHAWGQEHQGYLSSVQSHERLFLPLPERL